MSHTTTREPRKIICPPTATLISICTARTTRETYLGPIGETWSSRRHLKEVWALHACIIFARVLVKIFIQVDRRFPRRSEIFVIIVLYSYWPSTLSLSSIDNEFSCWNSYWLWRQEERIRDICKHECTSTRREYERNLQWSPHEVLVVHDHVHVPQCQCWQS